MASKNTLSLIKSNLDNYVGERVVLKANKGRKKISIKEGIIERTYPNIFVIRMDAEVTEDTGRTVSFSYSDILTKSIELFVCKSNAKIGCM
ncbi:MAG: Veg family protein [Bacillota bacterium]